MSCGSDLFANFRRMMNLVSLVSMIRQDWRSSIGICHLADHRRHDERSDRIADRYRPAPRPLARSKACVLEAGEFRFDCIVCRLRTCACGIRWMVCNFMTVLDWMRNRTPGYALARRRQCAALQTHMNMRAFDCLSSRLGAETNRRPRSWKIRGTRRPESGQTLFGNILEWPVVEPANPIPSNWARGDTARISLLASRCANLGACPGRSSYSFMTIAGLDAHPTSIRRARLRRYAARASHEYGYRLHPPAPRRERADARVMERRGRGMRRPRDPPAGCSAIS